MHTKEILYIMFEANSFMHIPLREKSPYSICVNAFCIPFVVCVWGGGGGGGRRELTLLYKQLLSDLLMC